MAPKNTPTGLPGTNGLRRVTIEAVIPQIDCGRFSIKRVLGEEVIVEADIFAEGHDQISAVLKWRQAAAESWSESGMEALGNDRWRGEFSVSALGSYSYTIEAWVDRFATWRRNLEKKFRAGQDVSNEVIAGAELLEETIRLAGLTEETDLQRAARMLSPKSSVPLAAKIAMAVSPRLSELMDRFGPREHATIYEKELHVTVDPTLARFSAWYEMFPRSCASEPGKHGTFKDCQALLPQVAKMGFNVLYFPPIHPIGRVHRKGKNNNPLVAPDDPGSPWAIGSAEGGHKTVHPELGTLEEFRALVKSARELRIEIALDIAFQCSPDHPYVQKHPEWFRPGADGSIQYAENPPKKYQDIYPLNFETGDWAPLWQELKSIFDFWIEQGVRVFRVDNPHTKPFPFWEWCLGELKTHHPELIFLAEAFTRPKVMYNLAKLGFTQSYNYFPWRNAKWEITQYFNELSESGVREYFRPILWPNTPDILTEYLQFGNRAAFVIRLILAATLGASYGIYGPPFELCEKTPREPGSEEYLDSEKYEIRFWNRNSPGNLNEIIARINQLRRENSALQSDELLRFHEVDNENLIAYSKQSPDGTNIVLVVVNLDPYHVQRGWLSLNPEGWGLDPRDSFQLDELLTNARYFRSGWRNYVELDPQFVPAHIFALRRRVRSEHDFDYFM